MVQGPPLPAGLPYQLMLLTTEADAYQTCMIAEAQLLHVTP